MKCTRSAIFFLKNIPELINELFLYSEKNHIQGRISSDSDSSSESFERFEPFLLWRRWPPLPPLPGRRLAPEPGT